MAGGLVAGHRDPWLTKVSWSAAESPQYAALLAAEVGPVRTLRVAVQHGGPDIVYLSRSGQRTAAAAARPAVRPENRQPPRKVPSNEL